jgi:hypothetical protein
LGAISGVVIHDSDLNGMQDTGEPGLAGQVVFLDLNNDGVLDPGDPSTTTDANGNYTFSGLTPGTYTVRQVLPGGVLLSTPASGSYQLTVVAGSNFSGEDFGDVQTSITVPLTLPPTTPFPKQGNATADYVEALYRAILQRNADPGGLQFCTQALNNNTLTPTQIVQAIRNSPEHFGQEVDAFYRTLLGRTADPAGRAGWVGELESGLPEEQMAFDFLDSPEYLGKGDKYFIDSMYQSLLGRPFDPSGEQGWLNALGDDSTGNPTHQATVTHEQVITNFLYSQESLSRLVEGYYEVFLQRPAAASEIDPWLPQLEQGLSFLSIGVQFLSSQEFRNKAAANG